MLNQSQKSDGVKPRHARIIGYNIKHIRLAKRIYTTSALGMQGVTRPSKNSDMPQQNMPKYKLRYGHIGLRNMLTHEANQSKY